MKLQKYPYAYPQIKHELNKLIRMKVGAHSQEIFYLMKFIYFKISKIVFVKKFLLLFF